jgi:hypothetical protein
MRLKNVTGLMIAVVLLLVASSGTAWAYFRTDGVGTDSQFSTGVLDLKVNRGSELGKLNVAGAMPGASGKTTYLLENEGGVAGMLSVSIPSVKNIAGTTGEFADGRGDLGAKTEVMLYLDMDGSGDWTEGDVGLRADGKTYADSWRNYASLDSYSAITWASVLNMAPANSVTLILDWRIPETVGNEIQGDSVSFDLSFTLQQID